MTHTACLVCLVSTVSGSSKNALGRGGASSMHITKLEQSILSMFPCLCVYLRITKKRKLQKWRERIIDRIKSTNWPSVIKKKRL